MRKYCIRCDEKLSKGFKKGSECPACGVTLYRFAVKRRGKYENQRRRRSGNMTNDLIFKRTKNDLYRIYFDNGRLATENSFGSVKEAKE